MNTVHDPPASTTRLQQAMKPRQLVMMSLGGAIGAGLFVGYRWIC